MALQLLTSANEMQISWGRRFGFVLKQFFEVAEIDQVTTSIYESERVTNKLKGNRNT